MSTDAVPASNGNLLLYTLLNNVQKYVYYMGKVWLNSLRTLLKESTIYTFLLFLDGTPPKLLGNDKLIKQNLTCDFLFKYQIYV